MEAVSFVTFLDEYIKWNKPEFTKEQTIEAMKYMSGVALAKSPDQYYSIQAMLFGILQYEKELSNIDVQIPILRVEIDQKYYDNDLEK